MDSSMVRFLLWARNIETINATQLSDNEIRSTEGSQKEICFQVLHKRTDTKQGGYK